MTTETTKTTAVAEKENKGPDYIVKQYRYVRVEDGFRLRKETIAAAWANTENGSIMIRPHGKQIIENDIYLFPTGSGEAE